MSTTYDVIVDKLLAGELVTYEDMALLGDDEVAALPTHGEVAGEGYVRAIEVLVPSPWSQWWVPVLVSAERWVEPIGRACRTVRLIDVEGRLTDEELAAIEDDGLAAVQRLSVAEPERWGEILLT